MGFYGAEVKSDRITWINASPESTIHLTNACLMSKAKKRNGRVVLQICNAANNSDTESLSVALGVLKASVVENIQLDVMVNSRMGLRLAGPESTGAVVHVVGNEFQFPPEAEEGSDTEDEDAIEISADLADVARMLDEGEVVLDQHSDPDHIMLDRLANTSDGSPNEDAHASNRSNAAAGGDANDHKENGKLVVKRKGPGLPLITHRSGLKFQDILIGSGRRVQKGHKVALHYVLRLENGKVVDRSDRKRPFKFRLGIGDCVKGFDIGVMGMREGGERHLIVPPELGYGDSHTPGIPKGSNLYFDITVIKAF